MTAANVRVCKLVSGRVEAAGRVRVRTYGCFLGQLNLLREAHEEDLWPLGNPLLVQLLLCGCARDIVGRLEALQEAREGGVDFGREDRHGVRWWWLWSGAWQ